MVWARTLLLVDGHAYAYRSFHAIRGLTSPTGRPTNAVYGFLKSLHKLRADLRPTHLAVVWDGGLARERMELLPQYKANRPPMPPALAEQLDEMVAWLDASGIASLCAEGVEADDWIATLARQAADTTARVVVASSDKDFMQLVSLPVGLLNPNDKTGAVWTADDVRGKSGVEPGQIVDWLSLVGDSVDNIPGVAGVGAKTATTLLRRFGSWECLRARLGEVEPERLRLALSAAAKLVARNQQLIRLKNDLPTDFDWDRLQPRAEQAERLQELYLRWGFRSLLAGPEKSRSRQGTLF